MENDNITCKNCDQKFQKAFEYCPYCGQRAKDDLTIGVLFYNTISNYFSFDARFFKSLIPLLFRPGYLSKKFVEGKRLLYLHPAQYYLFASVLFFFIFSFQAREYNQQVNKVLKESFKNDTILRLDSVPKKAIDSISIAEITQPLKDSQIITGMDTEEIEKLDSIIKNGANSNKEAGFNLGYKKNKLDSLIASGASEEEQLKAMGLKEGAGFLKRRAYTQLLKFQKNSGGGILQAFFDSIPIALFVLLPIFAFILTIFFCRRGSFSHHLVFGFYYFSYLFVIMSLVLIAHYFWKVPGWIVWLVGLATYLYLFLAIKKFYQQSFFLSFLKTGLTTFIYLLFVLPIALGIMVAASFLFY